MALVSPERSQALSASAHLAISSEVTVFKLVASVNPRVAHEEAAHLQGYLRTHSRGSWAVDTEPNPAMRGYMIVARRVDALDYHAYREWRTNAERQLIRAGWKKKNALNK